ncbi:DUF4157 domain-containing protein [Spirosoma sp.]|uniref:eCIS core domain-containing protein n=1 Tax=Spirosoma sp. TaxID=1899569 RepID=UPI0026304213|nr:DUF4157 domain-containing protein [Spirosoma sp.]MCX6219082.1 DUF4157 domain-containing protein [Spirosoma sp.]
MAYNPSLRTSLADRTIAPSQSTTSAGGQQQVWINDSPRQLQQLKKIAQLKAGIIQRKGLPDNLRQSMEKVSGISLNDVQVHYNSQKPAQVSALAYAQGTDIYLGPGQERHLAHEAWHIVQQKQGRVRPTTEVNGVAVNDNIQLEREADVMGAQASLG